MQSTAELELDDIQSGVLRPRPTPYVATYIALRIDDPKAGRALMKRASEVVTSAANPTSPLADTWASVALTYQGLKALGVPQQTLDSFSWEFRQGMAARALELGDAGESAPENWEEPLGSSDLHVVLVAVSPNEELLEAALERARETYRKMPGIKAIWRQNCHALPTETEPFGFRDGISHPAIEGSGIPGSNPRDLPLKAGEFVLGYRDELGGIQRTEPEVVGRNGTYVVFRKLHQRVAAFRQYLKANSTSVEDEELLAAKMMGRWRSGAPLVLAPEKDDPALGADAQRNNDFNYKKVDPLGYAVPLGSHCRRMNPRDTAANMNRRRMIRRGATYGPPLAEGAPEDGVERGIAAFVICASLIRQFEFAQNVWINDKNFHELGNERDPFIGLQDGTLEYKIPKRPIRKRITGLPAFTTVRGGAYFFLPGLKALRYLAGLGNAR